MPRESTGPTPEINLTPMIDVTLVILIILMVSVPIELQRISVRVPAPPVDIVPPPPDEEQLVFAVYADGSTALNRTLMDLDSLEAELVRRLRPRENKVVFIDVHGDVAFEHVVDAVDLASGAGGRIGLPRMKESGPLPPR